jgi:hypothetical protein
MFDILWHACEKNNVDLIAFLFGQGAYKLPPTINLLEIALKNNSRDVTRYLLKEWGGSRILGKKDNQISVASREKNIEAVRLLLAQGYTPDAHKYTLYCPWLMKNEPNRERRLEYIFEYVRYGFQVCRHILDVCRGRLYIMKFQKPLIFFFPCNR